MSDNFDSAQEDEIRVLFQKEIGAMTFEACVSSPDRQLFVRCLRDGNPFSANDQSGTSITARQVCRELLVDMTLAFEKWDRIREMQKVCISDAQLDILLHYFSKEDSAESDLFYRNLVSIHNPQQIGTIKTYLAWLRN